MMHLPRAKRTVCGLRERAANAPMTRTLPKLFGRNERRTKTGQVANGVYADLGFRGRDASLLTTTMRSAQATSDASFSRIHAAPMRADSKTDSSTRNVHIIPMRRVRSLYGSAVSVNTIISRESPRRSCCASKIPADHEPRRVHALYAGTRVVVNLLDDRTVALANRDDAIQPANAKRSDVKRILRAAGEHFDVLVAAWEKMHP
jgi:hypothetical protein